MIMYVTWKARDTGLVCCTKPIMKENKATVQGAKCGERFGMVLKAMQYK